MNVVILVVAIAVVVVIVVAVFCLSAWAIDRGIKDYIDYAKKEK